MKDQAARPVEVVVKKKSQPFCHYFVYFSSYNYALLLMFRKKISLLVSCFLSFWTFSQVPDYFPVGAVWHEVYREETGGDMS